MSSTDRGGPTTVAVQPGVAAGGSQAPVVNSWVRTSTVQAPFCGGGQVGLDDGEIGQAGQGAPAAAGGALLDLGRSDIALTLVIGEGHGEIDHEAQDHVFVVAEPAREGERILGQRPGPGGVVADPGGGGAAVAAADVGQDVGVELIVSGRAGGLGVLVGVGEQVGHRCGPELAPGVDAVKRGQISDQVRLIPTSG
jgi:hypothetical protein